MSSRDGRSGDLDNHHSIFILCSKTPLYGLLSNTNVNHFFPCFFSSHANSIGTRGRTGKRAVFFSQIQGMNTNLSSMNHLYPAKRTFGSLEVTVFNNNKRIVGYHNGIRGSFILFEHSSQSNESMLVAVQMQDDMIHLFKGTAYFGIGAANVAGPILEPEDEALDGSKLKVLHFHNNMTGDEGAMYIAEMSVLHYKPRDGLLANYNYYSRVSNGLNSGYTFSLFYTTKEVYGNYKITKMQEHLNNLSIMFFFAVSRFFPDLTHIYFWFHSSFKNGINEAATFFFPLNISAHVRFRFPASLDSIVRISLYGLWAANDTLYFFHAVYQILKKYIIER
ncbi:hypothetical protein ACJX0J_025987 [Zea mays]